MKNINHKNYFLKTEKIDEPKEEVKVEEKIEEPVEEVQKVKVEEVKPKTSTLKKYISKKKKTSKKYKEGGN